MIIDSEGLYHTRSDKPNEDWTGKAKYVIDDNSELAQKIINECSYGFTPVEDNDGNLIDVMPNEQPLEQLKQSKRDEISNACEQTIINGIDVNGEHFSLTYNDQINLSALYEQAKQGITNLLYHADGQLCRPFTADEIINLMTKATEFKVYHTTYCNHMFAWINRLETADEINVITYGAELPEDLQNHLNEVLGIETPT